MKLYSEEDMALAESLSETRSAALALECALEVAEEDGHALPVGKKLLRILSVLEQQVIAKRKEIQPVTLCSPDTASNRTGLTSSVVKKLLPRVAVPSKKKINDLLSDLMGSGGDVRAAVELVDVINTMSNALIQAGMAQPAKEENDAE